MAWTLFKLKPGEKRFIVVGHGYRLHGYLYQGPMKGDVFWGLKALESGHPARAKVLRRWTVEIPRKFGGAEHKNTGRDRKWLVFHSGAAASFVLRFEETIPDELVRDLRIAFREPEKESPHEEPAADPLVDPPGQAAGPGAGNGDDRNRHAAGPDQDPSHQGLEGREVVRAKKAFVKKPKVKKKRVIKNAARESRRIP